MCHYLPVYGLNSRYTSTFGAGKGVGAAPKVRARVHRS
jgi:hypothetical protein